MKLYGSLTSPYVRHIRVVLGEHQIKCEFVPTDYVGSAELSPTKRVPFLRDGETFLSDSSSILLYLKQQANLGGFNDVADYETYSLANSAMDAEINLFLLSRDGVTENNSAYMRRQRDRVLSTLSYLDANLRLDSNSTSFTDGQLRLACFLSWGLFRGRFELNDYPRLVALLESANRWSTFTDTAPPSDV